ncbi:hypothetical protein BavelB3_17140 [Bacillus velezensis]
MGKVIEGNFVCVNIDSAIKAPETIMKKTKDIKKKFFFIFIPPLTKIYSLHFP